MEIIRREKAEEIRSLARTFQAMAEDSDRPDDRSKLLQTASRLCDAADALESELLPIGTYG